MIINTGRGQLIHSNALIEGLKNKKISSAGLDVYEEESEYVSTKTSPTASSTTAIAPVCSHLTM